MDTFKIIDRRHVPAPGFTDPASPSWDPADVAAFEQALGGSPRAGGPEDPGSLLSMLSDYAGDHAHRLRGVERNLVRSAETADPMRMLELQRQYSQLMLQHAMAMKVVGKTVQGVDSLTKLQ